jgi:hypothetical protein
MSIPMANEIERGMDFDEWQKAWLGRCAERGHALKKDSWGGVDLFAYGGGHCNGPECEKCGWAVCMHCNWKGDKIPTCSAVSLHNHSTGEA